VDSKQTAQALYAAFNSHNMPAILDLLDNDVEWSSFSVDWALAIGYFHGHAGVQDFFAKLIGPDGQQTDSLFEPKDYFVSPESVHVIGIETGYLSANVLGGTVANHPFFNNFDHTLWFKNGKISRFRANYNLAQTGPTFWPHRLRAVKSKG
jgi:ketosteroid isomerase-like protein